jgi:Ca-activated chloride channel family protein
MHFLWPQFLWLLLAVPLLVAVYVWLMARKKKNTLRYASLSIVKEAMGAGQSVRRHIPPVLFLLALAAMLVAAARPVAVITLPSSQQTIMLAMDVSGSMRATDVQPNRLVAAQKPPKNSWPSCRVPSRWASSPLRARPRWRSCPPSTVKTW